MSIKDRWPEHCDDEGKPLLFGPNCEDCNKRIVVTYQCQACPQTFVVPGNMRWSWQGKSHYHKPDDETIYATISNHVMRHSPPSVAKVID